MGFCRAGIFYHSLAITNHTSSGHQSHTIWARLLGQPGSLSQSTLHSITNHTSSRHMSLGSRTSLARRGSPPSVGTPTATPGVPRSSLPRGGPGADSIFGIILVWESLTLQVRQHRLHLGNPPILVYLEEPLIRQYLPDHLHDR